MCMHIVLYNNVRVMLCTLVSYMNNINGGTRQTLYMMCNKRQSDICGLKVSCTVG